MNGTRGKVTIGNLIVFLMIMYAAFGLFKYVAANLEKKAIKKEVVDYLGSARGGGMSETDASLKLSEILTAHGGVTIVDEPLVEVDRERGKLRFYMKYTLTTNYLFFKRAEVIDLQDETDNYGL